MPHPANELSLVADVGGTNTRVALARGRHVLDGTVRRYGNADHPDIESVLRRFIADEGGVDPAAACVAAAGPVRDGRVTMTNIAHWPPIDREALMRASGAETVAILNDLQAQGYALGHLDAAKVRTLIAFPDAAERSTRLVIGVGTGFNAAAVFDAGGGRLVTASESGHVNLPVQDEADLRLAAWLSRRRGFASVEEVLSGRGMANVHAWLTEEDGAADGPGAPAGSAEIMERLVRGDGRALRSVAVFARMLGRVAGNLALIQLPFGGVWLAGGMARAVGPYLASNGFVEGFRDKGRFAPLMESFGVGIIEDDFAALTGSASHLVGLLERREAHG